MKNKDEFLKNDIKIVRVIILIIQWKLLIEIFYSMKENKKKINL